MTEPLVLYRAKVWWYQPVNYDDGPTEVLVYDPDPFNLEALQDYVARRASRQHPPPTQIVFQAAPVARFTNLPLTRTGEQLVADRAATMLDSMGPAAPRWTQFALTLP